MIKKKVCIMNIRHAQYIATIHECGSISAAAKKLYVSQPALSQMIQSIEKEIGTKIFDRSTTPISLTYAGENTWKRPAGRWSWKETSPDSCRRSKTKRAVKFELVSRRCGEAFFFRKYFLLL